MAQRSKARLEVRQARRGDIPGISALVERAYPGLPAGGRVELGIRPEFVQAGLAEGLPARVERVNVFVAACFP